MPTGMAHVSLGLSSTYSFAYVCVCVCVRQASSLFQLIQQPTGTKLFQRYFKMRHTLTHNRDHRITIPGLPIAPFTHIINLPCSVCRARALFFLCNAFRQCLALFMAYT